MEVCTEFSALQVTLLLGNGFARSVYINYLFPSCPTIPTTHHNYSLHSLFSALFLLAQYSPPALFPDILPPPLEESARWENNPIPS
jgi:hypothetical protein